MSQYVNLLEWGFQLVFFCLLLAVLVCARRLDRRLRQMRNDHVLFQQSLPQLDEALTTASANTDRLAHELRKIEVSLAEAMTAAETTTRKLDDTISQAVRTGSEVSARIAAAVPRDQPPVPVARPVGRAAAPRASTEGRSRAERDLARVLVDAP